MRTVLDIITATTGFFEKHGVESPRLNVEHLLAHALGKKRRLDLYMEFDRPLSEAELAPLRELVKRRAAGEPLQHLLGSVEFFGREFKSDARALIPRPETELLVEILLKKIREAGFETPSIVDVGTGSGVIGVTLAKELPGSHVTAVDRSPDALDLARENAAALECANIEFAESDLLEKVSGPFQVIAANLPYIPTEDIPALSREVQHDPCMALDGGPDGMALIARLIQALPGKILPGGMLALEIGDGQGAAASELLSGGNWEKVEVIPDYQGKERFVFAFYG